MKTLSSILMSLTALVIISTGCSKPAVTPTTPTTTSYTVSFNANGATGTVASQTVNSGTVITLPNSSALTYTGYTFVGWNTAAAGTGTSYATGASYTVTGNVTLYAIWQQNAPSYSAVFTAEDLSLTAATKALQGNDVAAAIKVNVTKAGSANLETIDALIGGASPISQFWITSRDSSEFFQMTSTLNPVLAKTVVNASQTIQLSLGTFFLCFKTAAYSGKTPNGGTIGLKLTGANTSIANASFTADVSSTNLATVVKIFCKFFPQKTDGIGPSTNDVWTTLQIIPYNDEAGNIYDGSLYPSISSVSFDTKDTRWISDTTGYSKLDFTATQNFVLNQDDNGTLSPIFQNSQATFSSGILKFSGNSGIKLVKSFLGNFSNCKLFTNVYNNGSAFGPANVAWYLKSIKFIGNPELWIYDPSGNRIW